MKIHNIFPNLKKIEPTVRYCGILSANDVQRIESLGLVPEDLDNISGTGDIDHRVQIMIDICGSALSRLLIADPYDFLVEHATGSKTKFVVYCSAAGSGHVSYQHTYRWMDIVVSDKDNDDVNHGFKPGISFVVHYDDVRGKSTIELGLGSMGDAVKLLRDLCMFGNWDYTDYSRKIEQKNINRAIIRNWLEKIAKHAVYHMIADTLIIYGIVKSAGMKKK